MPQPKRTVQVPLESFADKVQEEECTGAPKKDLLSWVASVSKN